MVRSERLANELKFVPVLTTKSDFSSMPEMMDQKVWAQC